MQFPPLPIGLVAIVAGLAGSFVSYAVVDPKKEIAVIQQKAQDHEKRDDEVKIDITKHLESLDNKMDVLNSKLDRVLLERRNEADTRPR